MPELSWCTIEETIQNTEELFNFFLNLVILCGLESQWGLIPSNVYVHVKSLQSYPTLCDHKDFSPPGSSVSGIFQARILEWVAMPSSSGSSRPREPTCFSYVSCIGRQVLYCQCHMGSPVPSKGIYKLKRNDRILWH